MRGDIRCACLFFFSPKTNTFEVDSFTEGWTDYLEEKQEAKKIKFDEVSNKSFDFVKLCSTIFPGFVCQDFTLENIHSDNILKCKKLVAISTKIITITNYTSFGN